jgi:microcystin-dependent protein
LLAELAAEVASLKLLVTGSVTPSGGSTAFSTWNAQTATGAYTLATADIPSHTHTIPGRGSGSASGIPTNAQEGGAGIFNTGSTGGGGSHTHSLTQSLKYYDFIIASKD